MEKGVKRNELLQRLAIQLLAYIQDSPETPLTYSTLREFMDKAGYSPGYPPNKALKTMNNQEILDPVIEQMELIRNSILKEMSKPKRISRARFAELNSAVENLTKTSQLLRGKATERIDLNDLAKKIEQEQDPLVKE